MKFGLFTFVAMELLGGWRRQSLTLPPKKEG